MNKQNKKRLAILNKTVNKIGGEKLTAARIKNQSVNNSQLSGFTLIEILVVISIIGFIATSAIYALNNARAKARDARRLSDIKTISKAVEMYYDDNDTYPGNGDGWHWNDACDAIGSQGTISSIPNFNSYLSPVPDDPNDNEQKGGGCYWYERIEKGSGYRILTTPELLDSNDDMGCLGGGYYCIGENWQQIN